MMHSINHSLVLYDHAGGVVTLTLNHPERHNALVPELIEALNAALTRAAQTMPASLVLRAAGRSFSTGGDVRRFYETPRPQRRDYAHTLVGALNQAIISLLNMPCPTIVMVHGLVTGGALGLVLACDLALAGPQASLAPWYTAVGFSPDGGWTALLPERIGRARALEIQLLNRQLDAEEAVRVGLFQSLAGEDALDVALAKILSTLEHAKPGSVRHTLALMRPDAEKIAVLLDAERQHFLQQLESDEAEAGMAAFLGGLA